ncbi:MAG: hypothetical protein HYU03_00310 [Thaumarchaeota archaeon]|nr:hypothetical protein [Nitrososphaerota archaeon]
MLSVRLRNGKIRPMGGMPLVDVEKPNPRKPFFSFKLPNESAWERAWNRIRPDEPKLKVAVGAEPVSASAIWRLKKD